MHYSDAEKALLREMNAYDSDKFLNLDEGLRISICWAAANLISYHSDRVRDMRTVVYDEGFVSGVEEGKEMRKAKTEKLRSEVKDLKGQIADLKYRIEEGV